MSILKKYKLKIILIILIITISTIGAYFSDKSSHNKKKIPKIDSQVKYLVTKILDGDTFQIKVKNQTVTVRMIGIDTPETVDPRKVVQCFGKEASDKTKELLLKHTVRLETDKTQSFTDKFGRFLAYIYRDDELFINKYLIEKGYAHEYTYDIPYEKQNEFKEAEKKARERKTGLWGEVCGKRRI